MFYRESSFVSYGKSACDLIALNYGSAVEVEFDFLKAWEYRKKNASYFESKYLHFCHVHPPEANFVSVKDLECLRGFQIAFGGEVQFSILNFKSDLLDDLDYDISYFALDSLGDITPVRRNLYIPLLYVAMLKALSYGETI